jgi:hypothetical protein
MSFGPTFTGPARPGPVSLRPGPARTVTGPKIFGPARPGPARALVTVFFPQNLKKNFLKMKNLKKIFLKMENFKKIFK